MVAIGTVDLPERVDRERYFRELSYMGAAVLHDERKTRNRQ